MLTKLIFEFKRLSFRSVLYLCGATLVVFCGIPLIWMLFTSLKPLEVLFSYPPAIFSHYTLSNFKRLFTDTYFLVYLKNSIVVAGTTVILDIVIATFGAYSLTRFRFVGKELLASLTLFTYMFAPIMIIIPVYVLLNDLGLTDSHLGIILAYTSISLPFTLWLLRAFFQSFPIDLEEAAFIDGANRFQSLVWVVIPQALPGIIATSVFAFVVVWNDFLFARVLLTSTHLKTMPIGLQDIYESTIVDWGLLMSAAVIVSIPALIFFLTIQKFLIKGWGMGAVKG
ncbi:MAG: carbohydrate ABC transporter permease [Desulfobacterales bacterium]|nr:MAG: carbohydrate ABC transporter permease [Desulfobacterales bacterium]